MIIFAELNQEKCIISQKHKDSTQETIFLHNLEQEHEKKNYQNIHKYLLSNLVFTEVQEFKNKQITITKKKNKNFMNIFAEIEFKKKWYNFTITQRFNSRNNLS